MKVVKTIKKKEEIEAPETDETMIEVITRDSVLERINHYLGNKALNLKDDDYCYVKCHGNHLVIGRARIVLEE